MVDVAWVSLPADWSLYSVQAGLQVVIAILGFTGIFVFARTCWQSTSLQVARNRPVSLPSLISIHTLGEAYDALVLLRFRIFHRQHWKILAQCVVVLLLSTATIVSGPIAKASTRMSTVVRPVPERGLMANRGFNSLGYGYVQWNDTISKLDAAGFPYDQLLDFIPDSEYDWVYREREWNSSWSMSCTRTESTQVTLYVTSNCTNLYTEIPGIQDFFPRENYNQIYPGYFGLYDGVAHIRDSLLVLTGWTPALESTRSGVTNMTFSVAAILVHDVRQSVNKSTGCTYDKGPIGSSSYTMVECVLGKVLNTNKVDPNAAYPDHRDLGTVATSYISHFTPRLSRESASNQTISPVSTDELIRFYQSYMVTKDTFRQNPVTRRISQRIPVPQVSATFLALASIMLALVIAGMINICWFAFKHFETLVYTPESKLDWAVQSITEKPAVAANDSVGAGTSSYKQYSVVAAVPLNHRAMATARDRSNLTKRRTGHLRQFFEGARFGNLHHNLLFHSSHYGGASGGNTGDYNSGQDNVGADESIPLKQYPGQIGITPATIPAPATTVEQYRDQPQAYPQGTSSQERIYPPPEPAFSNNYNHDYNISPFEAQYATYQTTSTLSPAISGATPTTGAMAAAAVATTATQNNQIVSREQNYSYYNNSGDYNPDYYNTSEYNPVHNPDYNVSGRSPWSHLNLGGSNGSVSDMTDAGTTGSGIGRAGYTRLRGRPET